MVIFSNNRKDLGWVSFHTGIVGTGFFGFEDGLSYLLEITSNDLLVKFFTIRIIYESCFGAKLNHTWSYNLT